jgi:hypothetical protein
VSRPPQWQQPPQVNPDWVAFANAVPAVVYQWVVVCPKCIQPVQRDQPVDKTDPLRPGSQKKGKGKKQDKGRQSARPKDGAKVEAEASARAAIAKSIAQWTSSVYGAETCQVTATEYREWGSELTWSAEEALVLRTTSMLELQVSLFEP